MIRLTSAAFTVAEEIGELLAIPRDIIIGFLSPMIRCDLIGIIEPLTRSMENV